MACKLIVIRISSDNLLNCFGIQGFGLYFRVFPVESKSQVARPVHVGIYHLSDGE